MKYGNRELARSRGRDFKGRLAAGGYRWKDRSSDLHVVSKLYPAIS